MSIAFSSVFYNLPGNTWRGSIIEYYSEADFATKYN